MVLVTAFLLLRELHNWLTRCGEAEIHRRQSEKEKIKKLRTKYNQIDNANNNTLRWLNVKSTTDLEKINQKTEDVIEKEESEIQRELASVRAVLEMREEELRKLRWKLDWSQVICDVKHIQTQTEDGLDDAVKKPLTHLVSESLVDGQDIVYQNLCDKSDLGQRGWSVTFYYNLI